MLKQAKTVSFKNFGLAFWHKSLSCPYCPEKESVQSGLYYNQNDAIPVIFCLIPMVKSKTKEEENPKNNWNSRFISTRLLECQSEFHNAGMCSMIIYIPYYAENDIPSDKDLILPHCQLALETRRIGLTHYLVFECPFIFSHHTMTVNGKSIFLKEYITNLMFELPWNNTFALYLGGKVKSIDMNRCLYNRGWQKNGFRTQTTGLLITAHFQNYVSDHLAPVLSQIIDSSKLPAQMLDCISDHLNVGNTYICNPSLVAARPLNANVIPTFEPRGPKRVAIWKQSLQEFHNMFMNWIGAIITVLGIATIFFIILYFTWK